MNLINIFGRHFDKYESFLNYFYTNRVPKNEFEKMLSQLDFKVIEEKNKFIQYNSSNTLSFLI